MSVCCFRSWVNIENNDTLFALPSTLTSVSRGIGPSMINTIVDVEGPVTFVSHALVGQRNPIPRTMSAPGKLHEQCSSPRSILRADTATVAGSDTSDSSVLLSREKRVKFSPTVMVNTIVPQNYAWHTFLVNMKLCDITNCIWCLEEKKLLSTFIANDFCVQNVELALKIYNHKCCC